VFDAASRNFEAAILISRVSRKTVLNRGIEETVKVVRAVYGDATAITGFYSYGEISISCKLTKCGLHNQTKTMITFSKS
jgi:hypothetical protein